MPDTAAIRSDTIIHPDTITINSVPFTSLVTKENINKILVNLGDFLIDRESDATKNEFISLITEDTK